MSQSSPTLGLLVHGRVSATHPPTPFQAGCALNSNGHLRYVTDTNGGSATDTAAVVALAQANNGGPTGSAAVNSPPGGGFAGACPF